MDGVLWWRTLILAVVQGVTEFLPISSDGHLVLIDHLLNVWLPVSESQAAKMQMVIVLHLGTLMAIVVAYWRDLLSLTQRWRLVGLLIVGTIPAGVFGLLFKDWFEQAFANPLIAGLGLCATAGFLLLGQRLELNLLELEQISWRHAALIGCCQASAILPGVSRSGSTIACALIVGLTRPAATTFSFLLAVPAVGGAMLLEGIDMLRGTSGGLPLPVLAFGVVVSFVVGLASLRLLLKVVSQRKLHWFAYYCLCVGAATIVWQLGFAMSAEPGR